MHVQNRELMYLYEGQTPENMSSVLPSKNLPDFVFQLTNLSSALGQTGQVRSISWAMTYHQAGGSTWTYTGTQSGPVIDVKFATDSSKGANEIGHDGFEGNLNSDAIEKLTQEGYRYILSDNRLTQALGVV